jgi:hypothetical protein
LGYELRVWLYRRDEHEILWGGEECLLCVTELAESRLIRDRRAEGRIRIPLQRARGVECTRESRPWAVATERSRRWTSCEMASRICVSSSSLASREAKMEGSRSVGGGGGADMVDEAGWLVAGSGW